MINKEAILKALQELRKNKKRNFSQTVDLIVNLRNFDTKRENINLIVDLPHKVRDKKVCAFLTKKSRIIDTITQQEFGGYKGKEAKKIADEYDFFIAVAPLMPSVATIFGKTLGPAGKMPSPQLGILVREEDREIKKILEKINKSVKIKSKESSLKIAVGKENMKDEETAENALVVYNKIFDALPRNKENLKSVLIKFTMSKPIKLDI